MEYNLRCEVKIYVIQTNIYLNYYIIYSAAINSFLFRIIHHKEFSKDELRAIRHLIFANIIESFQLIVDYMHQNQLEFELQDCQVNIRLLVSYSNIFSNLKMKFMNTVGKILRIFFRQLLDSIFG